MSFSNYVGDGTTSQGALATDTDVYPKSDARISAVVAAQKVTANHWNRVVKALDDIYQWFGRGTLRYLGFTLGTDPAPSSMGGSSQPGYAWFRANGSMALKEGGVLRPVYSAPTGTSSSSGSVTIDPTGLGRHRLTATGTITALTLSAGERGQWFSLHLIQKSDGVPSWPSTISNVLLPGGTFTKSLGANAVDALWLAWDDSASKWICFAYAQDVS